MWLYLIIVVGLLGGTVAALMGLGPIAFLLIALGVVGAVGKVVGGARAQTGSAPSTGGTMSSTGGRVTADRPQDTETRGQHVDTGVAHPGQRHMTPDQERLPG